MLQGHQSDWITAQLYFPGDFVSGGRQNSTVKVRFKREQTKCQWNADGVVVVVL